MTSVIQFDLVFKWVELQLLFANSIEDWGDYLLISDYYPVYYIYNLNRWQCLRVAWANLKSLMLSVYAVKTVMNQSRRVSKSWNKWGNNHRTYLLWWLTWLTHKLMSQTNSWHQLKLKRLYSQTALKILKDSIPSCWIYYTYMSVVQTPLLNTSNQSFRKFPSQKDPFIIWCC
jgi:hypothetical protein